MIIENMKKLYIQPKIIVEIEVVESSILDTSPSYGIRDAVGGGGFSGGGKPTGGSGDYAKERNMFDYDIEDDDY